MWEAFKKDKSNFKNFFTLKIIFGILFLVAALFLMNEYSAIHSKNSKERATYLTEADWLSKFDFRQAGFVRSQMPVPCKQAQAMDIVRERIKMFETCNVFVRDVKTTEFKSAQLLAKGSKVKYITTTINFEGTWPDIVRSLNSIEKKDFVVIANCKLNSAKIDPKQQNVVPKVVGSVAFRTYFE